MNQIKSSTISKPKNKNIHELTTEILDNVGIDESNSKYSDTYNKIYKLLTKKAFSAVTYGC
ncbi:hypothetical protein [Selenihalanaerobacter shriftii]|uniref:Uncharacterized protein n=1 Tax=Selenihalanaerobacter shriftii TaxID=142842 RepID=A0A1T4MPX5_9FIRM|nr:hypothetical protein [Selenihalanaerobacter shriftii]SJZ68887.1 hypothetical protein SAMN02745118_01557 [Selenihalanaerobacter shriftii]